MCHKHKCTRLHRAWQGLSNAPWEVQNGRRLSLQVPLLAPRYRWCEELFLNPEHVARRTELERPLTLNPNKGGKDAPRLGKCGLTSGVVGLLGMCPAGTPGPRFGTRFECGQGFLNLLTHVNTPHPGTRRTPSMFPGLISVFYHQVCWVEWSLGSLSPPSQPLT